jgi:hypothetical protein
MSMKKLSARLIATVLFVTASVGASAAVTTNGLWQNGVWQNGVRLTNGIQINGVALNGVTPQSNPLSSLASQSLTK